MNYLARSLRALWRHLDARGRLRMSVLLACLSVSGVAEVFSAVALFTYIAVVVGHAEGASGMALSALGWLGVMSPVERTVYGGIALLAAFALKSGLDMLTRFYLLRTVLRTYEGVAEQFFGNMLRRPLERFLTRSIQDYQHALEMAMTLFRTVLTAAVLVLVDIVLALMMVALLVFTVDPMLLLLIVGILGVTQALLLAGTKKLASSLAVEREDALRRLNFIRTDGFRGVIDLRLRDRIATVVDRFRKANGVFALSERRMRGMEMLPRSVNELVIAGAIVITAIYFAVSRRDIEAAFPALALLGFVGLRLTAIFARMTENLQRVREGQHNLEMFERDYSEAEREAGLAAAAPAPSTERAEIAFTTGLRLCDVCYRYPGSDEDALRHITLDVSARSFVGLCGPSGSGKTTLALIAMGLLDPTAGRVEIDGRPLPSVRPQWFRTIGYVGQSPYLSSLSLRHNVAFGQGEDDVDDARIWSALEQASLADVVRKMPEGLDTPMLDEGGRLSGGQRQRLCIARALYARPSVLFFDEATSALDPLTERTITEAIQAMRADRTIISIAHRLSTIRQCDMIHYFEAGRLIASGSFDYLSREVPSFAKLAAADDHGRAQAG